MRYAALSLVGLLTGLVGTIALAGPQQAGPVTDAEEAFLEFLDANGAVALIESGKVDRFEDKGLADWKRLSGERRLALRAALSRVGTVGVSGADAQAVAAMQKSLASRETDDSTAGVREQACKDAQRRDLDFAGMRAALVSCYVEFGDRLQFEGAVVDRGSALQLLHVLDEPARRKALFDAFVPLWAALNGRNEADSPYRRMIAMAAADGAKGGSEIDAAARAIGVESAEIERWLVQVLEAWRDASGPQMVEPWDYRYRNSVANREVAARIPADGLLPANERFYRDLGADLGRMGVVFDLAPRQDKSPFAYTEFLTRGRTVAGQWRMSVARVVATYPTGGIDSLNELVHENAHAVHVSAIRNRPAYMDWPDSVFTEAFADVPSWSVFEPAWQRRYLGTVVREAVSLRSLFSDVMLDVAWALFEMRMLREPSADPNAVWTEITSRYLHIVPHPEVPWWAMRVQLADSPGYMVNYGLGAVLTAEMRARTIESLGPFDAGNPAWYGWLSDRLLHYGSQRDTRSLMQELLGRPLSPAALLRQIERCRVPD
jgi:hypothetical protein